MGAFFGGIALFILTGDFPNTPPSMDFSRSSEAREWVSIGFSAIAALAVVMTLWHVAKQGSATTLQSYHLQAQVIENRIAALMRTRSLLLHINRIADSIPGYIADGDDVCKLFSAEFNELAKDTPFVFAELYKMGTNSDRTELGDLENRITFFAKNLSKISSSTTAAVVADVTNTAKKLKNDTSKYEEIAIKRYLPELEKQQETIRELYNRELNELTKSS